MTVVLFWDIDGTLLSTARAGVFAWEGAIREVLGSDRSLDSFPTAGMTDAEIATKLAEECGAGELLLSVVNNDGAENGFDLHVTEQLLNLVNIPVVVGSGAGKLDDIRSILDHGPSGVAIATLLHYNKTTISDVKSLL